MVVFSWDKLNLILTSLIRDNSFKTDPKEVFFMSTKKVLFTEDLDHGQVIDGVKIVNPFK